MNVIKVFLSMPYEGREGKELQDFIDNEIIKLKNIFRGYEIAVIPRERNTKSSNVIEHCDVCALGEGWTYIPECEEDRKFAVSLGRPIVITDTEYTKSFVRDYIVGKKKK